jgi:DNA ligase-1
MLFSEFSQFLNKIEHTPSRLEMTTILVDLFAKALPEEVDKICYLVRGRVTPLYVKQDFGLADKLVLKAALGAFSLEKKHANKIFKEYGDLGLAIEFYKLHSASLFESTTSLTVAEVFGELTKLSQLEGDKSQEKKLDILAHLFQELDALSCRFVSRIAVGKLRLGFSEMTVLDAFSWMLTGDKSLRSRIEKIYNVKPDIGDIGKRIKLLGEKALMKIDPQAGVPILMARAERVVTPADILAKIGRCAIEFKYDGFRLQVHRTKAGEVFVYSRNMEEVGYMYPEIVKAIKENFANIELIIEGEAVGYNEKTQKYLPFQETVQRKRKYGIEEMSRKIPLKLLVFELLLYNGISFIDRPYLERRTKLSLLLKKVETSVLALSMEQIVDTPKEINDLFAIAVKEGFEGIMAKKLAGTYEAGARGWNWIKFKNSYEGLVADTVDCLVMGYDYGQGKRTDFGIGAFLVGIIDKAKEHYYTIAKIGTGLTDVEWKTMQELCFANKTETQPENYVVNDLSKPDVWVKPQVVVEIRADEVTKSPAHSAGYALRFPRLEKFRPDKGVLDVTTHEELLSLFSAQKKLAI